MIQESPEEINTIISILTKIGIPAILIGAVKAIIMIQDKKVTWANALLSYLVGVVLAVSISYPLIDVLSNFWQLVLSSTLALAGENIVRAIVYKNDWNVIIDRIVDHILNLLKIKK